MSDDDVNWEYYRGVKIGTEMAAARIAELEAEVARLKAILEEAIEDKVAAAIRAQRQEAERDTLQRALDVATARVVELLTERDRLQEALQAVKPSRITATEQTHQRI